MTTTFPPADFKSALSACSNTLANIGAQGQIRTVTEWCLRPSPLPLGYLSGSARLSWLSPRFVLQVIRKTCECSPDLQWAWIPLTASPEGTLGAEFSHEAEECSATAIGAADEARTRNNLRGRQMLYQLNYSCKFASSGSYLVRKRTCRRKDTWCIPWDSNPGPTGYEPVALTNCAKDAYVRSCSTDTNDSNLHRLVWEARYRFRSLKGRFATGTRNPKGVFHGRWSTFRISSALH